MSLDCGFDFFGLKVYCLRKQRAALTVEVAEDGAKMRANSGRAIPSCVTLGTVIDPSPALSILRLAHFRFVLMT